MLSVVRRLSIEAEQLTALKELRAACTLTGPKGEFNRRDTGEAGVTVLVGLLREPKSPEVTSAVLQALHASTMQLEDWEKPTNKRALLAADGLSMLLCHLRQAPTAPLVSLILSKLAGDTKAKEVLIVESVISELVLLLDGENAETAENIMRILYRLTAEKGGKSQVR